MTEQAPERDARTRRFPARSWRRRARRWRHDRRRQRCRAPRTPTQEGVIGDWAADGSKDAAVPDSAATNASSVGRHVPQAQRRGLPGRRRETPYLRGPCRDHRNYECDICVVGAGGGRPERGGARGEQGARTTICVRPWACGGNAQEGRHVRHPRQARSCRSQALRVPVLPVRCAQAGRTGPSTSTTTLTDPHLIYRIAEAEGSACIDWMGDCGVRWRLGEGAVYVSRRTRRSTTTRAEDEDAARRHVQLRPNTAYQYLFKARPRALVQDGDGRIVGVVVREGYSEKIHPRRARRHPHGGRLLQQQGALAALHPAAWAAPAISHGRRDEREMLPHGPGRERQACQASTVPASFDGGVDWEAEGRPVGALARRHDAAVAPAVVHRRPLRQPSALHGQPRGRGRRERHLRWATWPPSDDPAGAPLLHRLRRALRGPSGGLRANIASSSRPTSSRSTRCPSTTH